MKICQLLTVLLLMTCLTGVSQQVQTQAIQKKSSFDSLYITPANDQLFKAIDSCYTLAHIALKMASDNLDSSKVFRLIGRIYLYKRDYLHARDTLNYVLKYLKVTNDTAELLKLNTLNGIGETFKGEMNYGKEKEKYNSAIKYYDSAWKPLTNKNDKNSKILKAKVWNNISEVSITQNEDKLAEHMFTQAANLLDSCLLEFKDTSSLSEINRVRGYVLETQGTYYEKKKQDSLAYKFYRKSYKLRDSLKGNDVYEFMIINFRLWKFQYLYPRAGDSTKYFDIMLSYSQKYSITQAFLFEGKLIESTLNDIIDDKKKESKAKDMFKVAFVIATVITLIACIFIFRSLRLGNRIKGLNSQLKKLNDIGDDIAKSISFAGTDISNFVKRIYANTNLLVNAPVVTVALFNDESQLLDYYSVENGKHMKLLSRPLTQTDSPMVDCFNKSKSIIIDDYESSPYYKALKVESETPKTMAAFPLIIEGNVIGVFTVQSAKKTTYRYQEPLLKDLANKIAISISTFRSYEKLYEANIIISTILSILKHDLTTPIKSGLVNVAMLRKTVLQGEKLTPGSFDLLNMAFLQLDDLLALTENHNLKIADARVAITLEKIQPESFFNNILVKYEAYYKSQDIDISMNLGDVSGFVSDKNIIRFILANFISNAHKSILTKKEAHPAHQGKIIITVSLNKEVQLLSIEVMDNGVGIPDPEHFFSNKTSTKLFTSGYGIAMTLCMHITANYNKDFMERLSTGQLVNNLKVHNNKPAGGCSFSLILPVNI